MSLGGRERAAKLLRGAAALIVERGWTQGQAEDRAGRLCPIGAMNIFGEEYPLPMGYPLACDSMWVETGMRIPNWNDQPDMTKEEVVETMLRVADKLVYES